VSVPASSTEDTAVPTRDRAHRLATALSRYAAQLPPAVDGQPPDDAWYEDIAAALVEGQTVVFHLSCPSRPGLRHAFEDLSRQVDPSGTLIRVTSSSTVDSVDALRRRVDRQATGTVVGMRLHPVILAASCLVEIGRLFHAFRARMEMHPRARRSQHQEERQRLLR